MMIDLGRHITIADFEQRLDKNFMVEAAGQQVPVKLRACQELPGSKRDGGGFRLEFAGPLDPQLGQGVFTFRIDQDQYGIFIVPLGQGERWMRYEAVFY